MPDHLNIKEEYFPAPPRLPATLVELLRWRAQHEPHRVAYTFLTDGETQAVQLTYGELERQACAIAVSIKEMGASGERILLLYPPGLHYVAAFFGCLYAGAVAVPAYPPRLNRSLMRLRSIVADAQVAVALTVSQVLSKMRPLLSQDPDLKSLKWMTTDQLAENECEVWQEPPLDSETLALLQYTSGSTGQPKGVMLSHGNLLHNSAMLCRAFEYSSESVCVSWLPIYHDMGLIGGVLQPLYGGFPCVLMAPMSFLQRPLRWLQAVSRYGATISGGPNFAYDLCVRKTSLEQRATLDLSNWNVAFNGSEPIRAETLERFTQAFEPCGFRRESFFTCYGLAEATLFVSGSEKSAAPGLANIQTRAFENNRVVLEPAGSKGSLTIVGSGRTLPEEKIVIAHPEKLTACAPEQVGEIWLAGPSIAQGYWNRPDETTTTFGAHLTDTGEGPFLRTGDLGFILDGELFVAGRIKDLIIIRGVNHYPQDIELTVEHSHPALRPGGSAAFAVEIGGQERLVICQEVAPHVERDLLIERIRQTVNEEHEVQVHTVLLLKPGTLPKTSSGKIQRHACRAEFLGGTLSSVAKWEASEGSQTPEVTPLPLAQPESADAVASWLSAQLSRRLGIDASLIDASQSITRYGLDSLEATELVHSIETNLGISLPAVSFLQSPSIAELAAQISQQLAVAAGVCKPGLTAAADGVAEHPLSRGQQAMWFLHQLAPESTAYNIFVALRINSELDVPVLHRAFQTLVNRHAALRTTFSAPQGEPVQYVRERMDVCFQPVEASGWNEATLNEYLVNEAHRPFDLEQGPLLRVHLLTRAPREHVVLLAVHHIVADFWSLAVLINELGILYTGERNGQAVTLPPLVWQYADYARWQEQVLTSADGDALQTFWQKQLEGELPSLNLPTDRPRPPVQSYQGASQTFRLSSALTRQLKSLSQSQEATLYMTLVAAFQAMLYRYTGQQDILIGSLAAGRSSAQLAGLVGYFTNPFVLRATPSADLTFESFLAQVRRTVLAAFAHQDYPFPLLVERLQPERDPSRSPIFQVMFALQKAPLLNKEGLAAFALGEEGGRMKLGELELESMLLEQRVAQFDLTLLMAEADGGLTGSLQYNTDLFEAETIARMAGHFESLLQGIAANPRQRLADLPLLTDAENRRLLREWNATGREVAQEVCLHHLFEAQARRTPAAIAVVSDGETITFDALNRRANQLAHHLRASGIGPETLVGICVERSVEMIVGLLGILKAGAAYVPLDPSYPAQRLAFILEDAGISVLLMQQKLVQKVHPGEAQVIVLDAGNRLLSQEKETDCESGGTAANLAYVIYTSGSTGQPKGVMINHRSVVNFCHGMDERVGCDSSDTLLAVTSISFDISVLELFWTLTRGAKVVLISEQPGSVTGQPQLPKIKREMQFSLFYFASNDTEAATDRYRLLMEGAKYADQHEFAAVWTPERHFHAFGGLYPNPSVMSAALAAITERVQIRAGSVVLPLHHPIRVAEEWSLVDNISKGRVGIAFASGWHSDDFVFYPEHYSGRKELMFEGIETVRKLWSGAALPVRGGAGNEIEVRIFPKPVQATLPIWITAAGSAETFIKAGEIGANILTHLLGQTVEEVAEKVRLYRESLARHGHDPQAGQVTLMLHTFIDEDRELVREKVRLPFTNYLRTSIGLIANLVRSLELPLDLQTMSPEDMDSLLAFAFDRYFETSALFGTPASCGAMIEQLKVIGVDEVACLIDFGVAADDALAGLSYLNTLRELSNNHQAESRDYSLPAQAARHQATLMQCTPSMMRMLSLEPDTFEALKSLRAVMLGGEALPAALARQVRDALPGKLINMYGPTETTIWSTTHDIREVGSAIPIGKPIANTQCYILDGHLRPVPARIAGELYIGGDGLARGYLKRPSLTAGKFIPDPFGTELGARLYRTGDQARYLPDGTIEFLGRTDFQVKLRGFRIELEEIETVLGEHGAVRETVVTVQERVSGDARLVAYLVAKPGLSPVIDELRSFMKEKLPEYMVPSIFVMLPALPLTANGKVDRKALPMPELTRPDLQAGYVPPRSNLEQSIAAVWQQVLKIEKAGVHDNFFDLGGHSLLMAQVHSQLEQNFQKSLPLVKLLEHPTISSLAKYLSQQQTAPPPSFEQNRDRAMKQRERFRRSGKTGPLQPIR
jgi:natural product biosynthesis luciferase-like monooxygenase protein